MGIKELVNAVATAAQQNKKQGSTAVQSGLVVGGMVNVAGSTYPYVAAVDIPINDGDWVYVMLTESKTKAVVVGR